MAKTSLRHNSFWIGTGVVILLLAILAWEWKRHGEKNEDLASGRAFQIPGGVLSSDKPEELSFYTGHVILGVIRGMGNYYDYSVFPASAIIQYPPRPASGPGSGGPGGAGQNTGTKPNFSAPAIAPDKNSPISKEKQPPKSPRAPSRVPPGHSGPPSPKELVNNVLHPPIQVLRLFSEADLPPNSKFIEIKLLLQTSNGSIDVIRVKAKAQSLTRAEWEAIKPISNRATVVVDEDWNPIARITP